MNPEEDLEEFLDETPPFDPTQHMLLSYLLANRSLWVRCSPILDENLFDPEYKPVVKYVKQYERKYNSLPSRRIIMSDTGVSLDIPEDANDVRIQNYVCDRTEEFVRHRATEEFIYSASRMMQKDNSKGAIEQLYKQMGEIAQISIQKDLGFDIHESPKEILKKAEANDGIPTGITLLDEALDGGTTIPSLNIVSASSGRGKSIWLQNIAVNYSQMGLDVVYYTLELEPATLMKRFAAMKTNTAISLVYADLDRIDMTMKNQRKKDGAIWLKKFPMGGTTMSDIKAHHRELCLATGLDFSFLCIDYVDLLETKHPGIRADDIHLKDKYVIEEMNDFAHEEGSEKIIWTASQQTKGAEDDKNAREGHMAGGAGKLRTADNQFTLKRTIEDKQEDLIWAHVVKARSSGGTDMKVPINWNSHTQRMTSGSRDKFIEANQFRFAQNKRGPSKPQSKDPIAREAGVVIGADNPPKEMEGKAQKANDTRSRILTQMNQGDRA